MNKNNKKGAAEKAKTKIEAGKLNYIQDTEGVGRGYTQNFGPARQSGYQKGAAKVNEIMGKGPGQGFWGKLGKTIKQGATDLGYQLHDMLEPDPKRAPLGGYVKATEIKNRENKNYDVSEKLAAEGKTFGSLAPWLRDTGRGGIFGGSRKK